MKPDDLRRDILTTVGEPEGIFHTIDMIAAYSQHAEQALGMFRALTEKTSLLTLEYGQGLYPIHQTHPDFIYPLRITLQKKQLAPATFAKVADANRTWAKTIGEPKKFFMVGCNYLGIYPAPPSTGLNLSITYIATPPIPSPDGEFMVSPEWHEVLMPYAAAIALAKEQKYQMADGQIREFLEKANIPRDPRFGPAEVKGSRMDEPLHPRSESEVG